MKKIRKRSLTALLLSGGMVLTSLTLPLPGGASSVAKAAGSGDGGQNADTVLAKYDFETENIDSVNSKIRDLSGKGNDAVYKGNGVEFSDGSLWLPGGAFGSGAGYVELPTGMFDDQNTLTISVWLKNETGAGNYAGMYFGTAESMPTGYWILNPSTPAGAYKSVITNSYDAVTPYNTEYGISPTIAANGITGPQTDDQWAMYTTVLQPDSITAYYNGEKIGTVETTRTVSEFGDDLVAYLGKSSYSDIFYKGGIDNLLVDTAAYTDAQVAALYYTELGDPAAANRALEEDAQQIDLPDEVIGSLDLPDTGQNGSEITWESTNSEYLAADGTVNRPAAEAGDQTVTLTATFTLAGETIKKPFDIKVLADAPENDLKIMMQNFALAQSVVTEDMYLPDSIGEGTAVTWSSDGEQYLSHEGKVTRPAAGEGNQTVRLTASVEYKGISDEKTFTVTVKEADYGMLAAYIKSGNTDRTDALHYAVSTDGENWEELNGGKPVLYPSAGSNKMGSPVIFLREDGTFGLAATDDDNSTYIYVYDSEDLITYTNPRYVSVNSDGVNVTDLQVDYDSARQAYAVYYTGGDGTGYVVYTEDFSSFTAAEEADYTKDRANGSLPEDAEDAAAFGLTKSEYDALIMKYGRITNTSVSDFADITVKKGTDLSTVELPDTLTASYSDGSTKEFGVVWDEESLEQADTSKVGEYTVTGTVVHPVYDEVLVEQRADPYVIRDEENDCYYFTGTYPICGNAEDAAGVGNDRIVLRKADTISGLSDANEVEIWNQNDSAKANRYIWAPELHKIGGSWYILFTASRSNNVWDIRPHMLKCMGDDPMDPANWKTADESNLYQVQANPGDPLAFTQFSLDMTYFEANGQSYVAWAEKPNGISKIYLATVNPEAPWQLTSDAVVLSEPDYAWEWSNGTIINEGPAVLKHDGKVFLCFSGAAVDYSYCIGMLSADEGSDLLNLDSWTKYPTPLLSSDDFEDQCGPGHNSFTYDENGNPVLVYHARPVKDCSNGMDADGNFGHCEYQGPGQNALNDPCRHARVKSLNFAADGTPVLNMTAEEELSAGNEQVKVKIVVTEEEEPSGPENPDPENPDPDKPQPEETDKSLLQTSVDKWEDIDRNQYTEASWQAWKTAYEYAVSVLADEDASQEEIDQALKDLETAGAGLIKKEDGSAVPAPGSGSEGPGSGSEGENGGHNNGGSDKAVQTGDTASAGVLALVTGVSFMLVLLLAGLRIKQKNSR